MSYEPEHGMTFCGFQRKEDSDTEAQYVMTCQCGFEAWGDTLGGVGTLMDEHLEGKEQ